MKTDIRRICQGKGRKLGEDQKRSLPEIRPSFVCMLTELRLIECWSNYLSARELIGPSSPLGPGTVYLPEPSLSQSLSRR